MARRRIPANPQFALRHRAGGAGGKSAQKPRNMAEALDSLGGTFHGPNDLATNPKHLEGFGQ